MGVCLPASLGGPNGLNRHSHALLRLQYGRQRRENLSKGTEQWSFRGAESET